MLGLRADDRVLVLGASGWFGRTFLDIVGLRAAVLAVASTGHGRFCAWDVAEARDFAPTVVANFAFLTSERVAVEGFEEFVRINEMLTERLMTVASWPGVRAVITASSGAAVAFPLDFTTNPYGVLKQREHEAALSLATAQRSVVVARAWSVSGQHVRRPTDYAFSDFIMQASKGRVLVSASRPVYRRYISAEDFLRVCAWHVLQGWTGVIDSGGELIEMQPLAEKIAAVVNPVASVERAEMTSLEPSTYASDNDTWTRACKQMELHPLDLDGQIRVTATGLLRT